MDLVTHCWESTNGEYLHTLVRKLVGYERYSSLEAREFLGRIYVKAHCQGAKTPFQQVLSSPEEKLGEMYHQLSPSAGRSRGIYTDVPGFGNSYS